MRDEDGNEIRKRFFFASSNRIETTINGSLAANEYYPSVLSANSNDVMDLVSAHIHMTCMRGAEQRRRGDHMPSFFVRSFFLFFSFFLSLSFSRSSPRVAAAIVKIYVRNRL